MTTNEITEYCQQVTRARRNFALCVVELQREPSLSYVWKDKADRLQSAIARAERFAAFGKFKEAATLLGKENEPA